MVRIVALTRQAPLVLVDNIFLTPFYVSLFLHSTDIFTHFLTKYINGHSDVVMGAAILPSSSTPDRDYDSLTQKLHFLQNACGTIPSKFDYWLAQCGAKTLAVRMKTHNLNALCIASHLRHALTRTSLSPHTQQFFNTFPQSTLAHGIPYGGMVLFHGHGGTRSAEALLPKWKSHTCCWRMRIAGARVGW